MGVELGKKGKVLKIWKYYSPAKGKRVTKATIYFYDNVPYKECKAEFALMGDSLRKGVKVGDEITVVTSEVIGNKTKGYEFILWSHETQEDEKRQEWIEQYIGTFDLPDENPFE